MSKTTAKLTILGATFSILAALMSVPLVALANNWAGSERRGYGVSSFEFLFPYSVRTPLGTGESQINFTMNYDLDY